MAHDYDAEDRAAAAVALHARHLCVACGQPVPRIRRKAAADSMHHEYCRRLGYSSGAAGAPESGEGDDE